MGRAVLLIGLGGLLLGWARRPGQGSPRLVGWTYLVAAGLSLLLAADVTLFHTSIPSWMALAAPLVAVAWELMIPRSSR